MSRRTAWTLLELLVVMAIIGVLLALLVAAVQRVRAAADRARCANNLHQLALAAHHFHDAFQRLPPGTNHNSLGSDIPVYGPGVNELPKGAYYNWAVSLLPYLDQQPLYDRIVALSASGVGWTNEPGPDSAPSTTIPVLVCPADAIQGKKIFYRLKIGDEDLSFYEGVRSYLANTGTQISTSLTGYRTPEAESGMFYYNSKVRLSEATDGTSCTLLFGERYTFDPLWAAYWAAFSSDLPPPLNGPPFNDLLYQAMWFGGPGQSWGAAGPGTYINYQLATVPDTYEDAYLRMYAYGSGHPGGAQFAFADGSVRFLSNALPYQILHDLSTKAGGEVIAEDF